MLIATMKSTANGIYDKDPDTEEPDECESLKSGSGVAAGWATAPPTITWAVFSRTTINLYVFPILIYGKSSGFGLGLRMK
jgi:hypothetical protein